MANEQPSDPHSQAQSPPRRKRVSSPASTGGAGTFFEQHVDATLLALLLVEAPPPTITDGHITSVCFQAEQLGFECDDFLVTFANGQGVEQKLLGQVKRNFTVSAADDECKKVIGDCWKDHCSGKLDPTVDRFAIVTLRGTKILLESFAGLLDGTRAASSSDDFARRLATPGFFNSKVTTYYSEIKTIVEAHAQESVTDLDVWRFLKTIYLVSMDLTTSTKQTESIVRLLLAHTCNEADARGAADRSWGQLLRVASEGMAEAKCFRRFDLPADLLKRHAGIGSKAGNALTALAAHSSIILAGIKTSIGHGLHLKREGLIQSALNALDETQVVLITGASGSGKSAVAKGVADVLQRECFTFAFRAEEFAAAHFDHVLHHAQVGASTVYVSSILAGQDRKVLFVESLERLLEAAVRDAFADLLTLLSSDPTWKLVVTCRDYSSEQVRAALLSRAALSHSIVMVPLVSEAELNESAVSHPQLAPLIANTQIKTLLRTPYLLDTAVRVQWQAGSSLPATEHAFRQYFWTYVVQDAGMTGEAMPRRRDAAMIEVALRRARALTQFASCDDLDRKALDRLNADGLVTFSPQSESLAAPAHDVLEDWSILRWIDKVFVELGDDPHKLAEALGPYPAIRRSFRMWLRELASRGRDDANSLFSAALHHEGLPPYFRDDVLVALLRSPGAREILNGVANQLLSNDRRLLHRVIHLLRVGCVSPPPWLPEGNSLSIAWQVPTGDAWATLLQLVEAHVSELDTRDRPHVVGLLKDWSKGVSVYAPYPDGSNSVFPLAHHYLATTDRYRRESEFNSLLQVIAKLPKSNRKRFAHLLLGGIEGKRSGRMSEAFRDYLLNGIECIPACRDVPNTMIKACRQHFMVKEDSTDDFGHGDSLNWERKYGIPEDKHTDFFPASAQRGPFKPLLDYHPMKGLAFVLEFANHCSRWRVATHDAAEELAPIFLMELQLPTGERVKQIGSTVLWNLYRGTSVGPCILQSALMALEAKLLEAARSVQDLNALLFGILEKSESVLTTSVVASVAVSNPHASSEVLLALLKTRECVLLDRLRLSAESQDTSRFDGWLPTFDPMQQFYNKERRESGELPHRRHDLEWAVLNLQLGPRRDDVHKLIDEHRHALPSRDTQTETDLDWRLALDRMDIRTFRVVDVLEHTESEQNGSHLIRVQSTPSDPELQQIVSDSAASLAAMERQISLQMWGLSVFEGRDSKTHPPELWRDRLTDARDLLSSESDNSLEAGSNGAAFIAAVCVRDHWDDLLDGERDWCIQVICGMIGMEAELWNDLASIQRYKMRGDRPSAWAISAILAKNVDPDSESYLTEWFSAALLHPVDEVRDYAIGGVVHNLSGDGTAVVRCANALATEAAIILKAVAESELIPWHERPTLRSHQKDAAASVRSQFNAGFTFSETACVDFDSSSHVGAIANLRVLALLSGLPSNPIAENAFGQLSQVIVGWWRRNRRDRGDAPLELVYRFCDMLARYGLRCEPGPAERLLKPILNAVDGSPREVANFFKNVISAEDQNPTTDAFWRIWKSFASQAMVAGWLDGIDREHAVGQELIAALFLSVEWKQGTREWHSVSGREGNIERFLLQLPPSAEALECYSRFLFYVGRPSLPRAFVVVAESMARNQSCDRHLTTSTLFYLESVLSDRVYLTPHELKRSREIREAVLQILDVMVEAGSSVAYRMRDDFVTPAS